MELGGFGGCVGVVLLVHASCLAGQLKSSSEFEPLLLQLTYLLGCIQQILLELDEFLLSLKALPLELLHLARPLLLDCAQPLLELGCASDLHLLVLEQQRREVLGFRFGCLVLQEEQVKLAVEFLLEVRPAEELPLQPLHLLLHLLPFLALDYKFLCEGSLL